MKLQEQYAAEIEELAAAARRLGERGFVASHGGNLSYKVAPDVILITPTKVVKRQMQFDDIVMVAPDGSVLFAAEGRRPTGETPMHTRLYALRPDANALVHAHPPVLTGFSMTESTILSRPLLPEPVLEAGPILPVEYAEPITDELAAKFEAVVAWSNAWLMRNHGFTICSSEGIARTLEQLEMLEAMAQSVAAALAAGLEVTEIPRDEVAKLENTLRTRKMPRPGDPRVIKSLLNLFYK